MRPQPTEQQLKAMYLRQRQGLPLEIVVKMSERRIRAFYEYYAGEVYVSVSGKDSHTLLHVVRSIYPDVPAVFVDTGLEYPEVRDLNLRTQNCTVLKPEMAFPQVIERYGWPVISKLTAKALRRIQNPTPQNAQSVRLALTGIKSDGTKSSCFKLPDKWRFLIHAPFKIGEQCCDVMKKKPIHVYNRKTGRKAFVGTMASESRSRQSAYFRNGCNSFSQGQSKPISFWSEQHVLQYIQTRGIEIAACYGDMVETANGLKLTGEQRTGCMFCAFGAHMDASPNRFERMERTHPKQWKYCMEKLGLKEVLQYCGIPWGKEQMDLFDKEVA
jgi:3'-phosphoadenosine 5'-phosphosulfate sulfotransferase (PAPS reductase)/FAD synthetase